MRAGCGSGYSGPGREIQGGGESSLADFAPPVIPACRYPVLIGFRRLQVERRVATANVLTIYEAKGLEFNDVLVGRPAAALGASVSPACFLICLLLHALRLAREAVGTNSICPSG